jgi:hypothetical protein
MDPDYATMPAEALLEALEQAGRKPDLALLQAVLDHAAEVTPTLLAWLDAGSDPSWPDDDPRWFREIHAGHVLIELREPAALPLFEAIYRDPEREDALSEWFTTELPAYGPALIPTLLALVADAENEWARINALEMLGTLGRMHPEERARIGEVVRALLPALRQDGTLDLPVAPEDVSDEDVEAWTWAVSTLMDLRDEASAPLVRALYAADLIDEMVLGGIERYEAALRGEQTYEHRPVGLLRYYEQSWDGVSGSGGEGVEDWLGLLSELDDDVDDEVEEDGALWPRHQEPVRSVPVRSVPVPGRNAPCPCGSGRKYKHCCGRPEAHA